MRERYPELKKRMRERRIRVYAMAEKLGVTRDTLARWVNGESRMPLEDAMRIRRLFFPECSIEELFGENEKRPAL